MKALLACINLAETGFKVIGKHLPSNLMVLINTDKWAIPPLYAWLMEKLAESKDQEVTITIDGINRSINKLLMLGAKPVVYTTFREYDDENKILIRQSVEEGGCHIDAESKDQEVTITIDGINRSINKLLMLGAKPVVYTTFREYDDENKILIRQSVEEGGCHIDGAKPVVYTTFSEYDDENKILIRQSVEEGGCRIDAESKDQEVTITIDGINRSINKLLMLGAKPVVYTTFREYDDENKILIRQSVEEGGCHIDAESKDQEVTITIDGINRSINKLLMLGAKPVVYTTFREYDDENKILIRQSVEEGGCHIDAESKDQEVTITIDGINRSINKLLMLGAKPVVYTTFREYDDENKILIRQSVEEGGCHIDAESKDQEVTITIDGINRSINKLLMLGAKPVVYTTFREYDDENKILIRQSVEEGGCHID
ncbi:Hypothetical predicted protein, partial [Mytilus galloprovincialis]